MAGLAEWAEWSDYEDSQRDELMQKTGIFKLLNNTTLQDVLQARANRHHVISVGGQDTLHQALQKMKSKHILSAPVVSLNGPHDVIGILDSLSVVHSLVDFLAEHNFDMHQRDAAALKRIGEFLAQDVTAFLKNASPVNDMGMLWKYEASSSMMQIITEVFLDKGVHRVLMYRNNGQPETVFSQSDVMRWLRDSSKSISKFSKSTIGQLGMRSCVVTVQQTEWAVRAFQKMVAENVSSLAVVDRHGILRGNLSASDLVRFDFSHPDHIYFTVERFLQEVQGDHSGGRKHYVGPIADISVTEGCTFDNVIRLLTFHRIHRVYLVDGTHQPVGVVSLSDVLKMVTPATAKYR